MPFTIDATKRSPNHSSRNGARIELIVLHATAGSYASSLAWLCNPASKVSTHYLIRKDGHIAQLVSDIFAAWHAGKSEWRGLDSEQIQEGSLGIELENANDGHDPYPQVQIEALTWLVQSKLTQYGLTPLALTRHLDIAIPEGRKTDPAGFPWDTWIASLLGVRTYRVKGVPVYQAPTGTGALWGHVQPGEQVAIDRQYPNGLAHLADGRGFIELAALEPL